MKKVILVLTMMLCVGCTQEKSLKCVLNNYEFENAKINATVIYHLDKDNIITSIDKKERRVYQTEEEAKTFYQVHKDRSTMVNNTEVEYKESLSSKDKVNAELIKAAMEAQQYICGYE